MLKIGLFGYGKMGKIIERLALADGHAIVWAINRENQALISLEKMRTADVVIEFSTPEAAFENIRKCLEIGLPVISGTTGWLEDFERAKLVCLEKNGAFLWSSNFSVGVNLLFEINRKLAILMQNQVNYRPSMLEIHHIHKLDAPSGTAVTLAEDLIFYSKKVEKWSKTPDSETLFIESRREGEVPGTHIIDWKSPIDRISISHEAHSREGFAAGAILAATWIIGRKGVFGMQDVLGF
jgi:4-hydroxy-tetrahydrodipicolinate reductase